ncbi:nuclease [Leptospira noguchii]|nr:nuclease [Leptospira noguchii]UOG59008.1 nuclease [Leptospira noguchii]
MKAVDKNITELLIARHTILQAFVLMGITDMTEIAKTLIDSSACNMVFLRKNNLTEDHEEFVNELKIEMISLEKKHAQKKQEEQDYKTNPHKDKDA